MRDLRSAALYNHPEKGLIKEMLDKDAKLPKLVIENCPVGSWNDSLSILNGKQIAVNYQEDHFHVCKNYLRSE